ncbi:MAG: 4Fe-4S dicluster domain-containing protein [Planctomycetota bacterium]|nr:MAG: 4Fe-4S dicluster domain-containing protein [Planctomycetota bacterium]
MSTTTRPIGGFYQWCRNIVLGVKTVAEAMAVTMRTWISTYDPKRRAFTHHYEYPELPAVVAPRFRGFHRYDLTTCIGCLRCAKDCPVDCIYIEREKVPGRKGFRVTSFIIDYTKCMFCAYCTENCPSDCIFMGSTYDLSCYSRDGCMVDFAKLPLEIAWGQTTLNPTVVALSKSIAEPVDEGPNAPGRQKEPAAGKKTASPKKNADS